jgi:hypothetical protein
VVVEVLQELLEVEVFQEEMVVEEQGGVNPSTAGAAGTINTGSGGGGGGNGTGGSTQSGAAGGKGVVILSMPLASFSKQQQVLQQNQMMGQLKF